MSSEPVDHRKLVVPQGAMRNNRRRLRALVPRHERGEHTHLACPGSRAQDIIRQLSWKKLAQSSHLPTFRHFYIQVIIGDPAMYVHFDAQVSDHVNVADAGRGELSVAAHNALTHGSTVHLDTPLDERDAA